MTTRNPAVADADAVSAPDGLVVNDPDELRRLVAGLLPDDGNRRLSAVLREIAAERERERMQEVPDDAAGYLAEVPPSEDREPLEVLSNILQGVWAPHQWIRFHDYALYHERLGDHEADVWQVHHVDSGEYIDTLNVAAFRSATALESWLLDLQAAAPTTRAEWRQAREAADA